jgi:hypothetical protein
MSHVFTGFSKPSSLYHQSNSARFLEGLHSDEILSQSTEITAQVHPLAWMVRVGSLNEFLIQRNGAQSPCLNHSCVCADRPLSSDQSQRRE